MKQFMKKFCEFTLSLLLAQNLTAKKDDYITFNLISSHNKTHKLIRVRKCADIRRNSFVSSPKKSINDNFAMLIKKLRKH